MLSPEDLERIEARMRELMAEAQLAAGDGRRTDDAIKRTKRALHQIFGAYLPQPPRYERWLGELDAATTDAARHEVLRRAMAQHASTRERLEQLERFYAQLREHLGPVASVLDLACGLGPLAAPWLGLPVGTVKAQVHHGRRLARPLLRGDE